MDERTSLLAQMNSVGANKKPAFGQLRRGGNPLDQKKSKAAVPLQKKEPQTRAATTESQSVKVGPLVDSIRDTNSGALMDYHAPESVLIKLHEDMRKFVFNGEDGVSDYADMEGRTEEEEQLIRTGKFTPNNQSIYTAVARFDDSVLHNQGEGARGDSNEAFMVGYTDPITGLTTGVLVLVGDKDNPEKREKLRRQCVSVLVTVEENGQLNSYRVYLQDKSKGEREKGNIVKLDKEGKESEVMPSNHFDGVFDIPAMMDKAIFVDRKLLNQAKEAVRESDKSQTSTAYRDTAKFGKSSKRKDETRGVALIG